MVAGGGPMARLPQLIGRNRAMEVLLSSDDIRGEQAEAYGYVNRALPDAELDAYVDALATRISRFDKWAIGQTKRLVNTSLPPDVELGAGWDACIASLGRPAAQEGIKALTAEGFQAPGDVESRLGFHLGRAPALARRSPSSSGRTILMDLLTKAKTLAARVEAEATKAKVPVAVCIIDVHGNLVLQHRMNGAPLFSLEISERKAYTSALVGCARPTFSRSSSRASRSMRSPRSAAAASAPWAAALRCSTTTARCSPASASAAARPRRTSPSSRRPFDSH